MPFAAGFTPDPANKPVSPQAIAAQWAKPPLLLDGAGNPITTDPKLRIFPSGTEGGFAYNSYAGSDYQIMFLFNKADRKEGTAEGAPDFVNVCTLQTVSISSARSLYPVRRIGENHVPAYCAGARTISGSLIFTIAAQDVFSKVMAYSSTETLYGRPIPFFIDQLPEFTILIYASNEYGHTASAAIVGVRLTNFGQAMSVDDIYTESQYTFVARYYFPLIPDDPAVFLHNLVPDPVSTHDSVGKYFASSSEVSSLSTTINIPDLIRGILNAHDANLLTKILNKGSK